MANKKITFVCSDCKLIFKTYKEYSAHDRCHKDSNIKCELCGEIFVHKGHLKRHMDRKIPCSKDINTCNICGKKYSTYRSLLRHLEDNCKKPDSEEEEIIMRWRLKNIKDINPEHFDEHDKMVYAKCILDKKVPTKPKKVVKINNINKGVINNVTNNTVINGDVSVDNRKIVNNNNIAINPYGREDLSQINYKFLTELVLDETNSKQIVIAESIKEVHNNPKIPQNKNMKYDPRTGKIYVWDDVDGVYTWRLHKDLPNNTISRMTRKYIDSLLDAPGAKIHVAESDMERYDATIDSYYTPMSKDEFELYVSSLPQVPMTKLITN